MSTLFSFTPIFLGLMIVLQSGLNRKIAVQWGLPMAVLFNSIILIVSATLFFVMNSNENRTLLHIQSFKPWYILPGIIGFAIVIGGPYAIARWGAVHTFVLIISAQLVASVLWDYQIENIEISKTRLVGIAITWIGAFLATRYH